MSSANLSAQRTHRLSASTEELLRAALSDHLKADLQDDRKLADCVLQLSDYFTQQNGAATPWNEKWCQIAYLVYYAPLNALRLESVLEECLNLGFLSPSERVLDFGSGLGSFSWAWQNHLATSAQDFEFHIHEYEPHSEARRLAALIQQSRDQEARTMSSDSKPSRIDVADSLPRQPPSLAVLSYSLVESGQVPSELLKAQKLIIMEPSTRLQGRRLMELRTKLIKQGYFIWAPCVHQDSCPLLLHSEKDWCHDRIAFEQPSWFQALESHLPVKNQTLTLSYLCASREPPPQSLSREARITGDLLIEKGKRRQLICQNSERLFLTWLDRHWKKTDVGYPRGVRAPRSEGTATGNELRIERS